MTRYAWGMVAVWTVSLAWCVAVWAAIAWVTVKYVL